MKFQWSKSGSYQEKHMLEAISHLPILSSPFTTQTGQGYAIYMLDDYAVQFDIRKWFQVTWWLWEKSPYGSDTWRDRLPGWLGWGSCYHYCQGSKSLFHKMGNVIRVQMWVDESIFKMRKLFHVGACRLFFLHHALANTAHHDQRSVIIDCFC